MSRSIIVTAEMREAAQSLLDRDDADRRAAKLAINNARNPVAQAEAGARWRATLKDPIRRKLKKIAAGEWRTINADFWRAVRDAGAAAGLAAFDAREAAFRAAVKSADAQMWARFWAMCDAPGATDGVAQVLLARQTAGRMCAKCSAPLAAERSTARYCGPTCRFRARKARRQAAGFSRDYLDP
jgi:hypothetical protein